MNFVVIGTDHRMQHSDAGFEAILRAWLGLSYIVPLAAIAEEYHKDIGSTSIGQRLAKERGLDWYNVDMTTAERQKAGILEEQSNLRGCFRKLSAIVSHPMT
jgi:hypothetical protein